MLLPALLLAPALLLTVSTVGPPAPGRVCAPPAALMVTTATCGPAPAYAPGVPFGWLAEAGPVARVGLVHRAATDTFGPPEGRAGVLPAVRAVVAATGPAVAAPAQSPGATTPPTSNQPTPASDGSGLARWQAAVIAVVVAAAVVWLVGRVRRAGRRR
jgi:hypothetical protein